MLILCVGRPFLVGDSAPVRINGKPATVTWRDPGTLVVAGEADAGTGPRRILEFHSTDDARSRPVICFTCE